MGIHDLTPQELRQTKLSIDSFLSFDSFWLLRVTFAFRLEFAVGKLPRASAGKHRRGPSTTRYRASVCDRSVMRFAQDDGFAGELGYSWLGTLKHEKSKKPQGRRTTSYRSQFSVTDTSLWAPLPENRVLFVR